VGGSGQSLAILPPDAPRRLHFLQQPQALAHQADIRRACVATDASADRYHHNRTGEDNADAHLKRQVMGREVVLAITGGKLHLGPWERIFYYEFDGRRKKRVLVKIIGE
jgi:secondary thiamine-phosphate synthase enzyme